MVRYWLNLVQGTMYDFKMCNAKFLFVNCIACLDFNHCDMNYLSISGIAKSASVLIVFGSSFVKSALGVVAVKNESHQFVRNGECNWHLALACCL